MDTKAIVIYKQAGPLKWVTERKEGEAIKRTQHTSLRKALASIVSQTAGISQIQMAIVCEVRNESV